MNSRNALLIAMLLFTTHLIAEVRVPKLISNRMILQRDVELNIWGWASNDERVTLIFKKKKFNTIANKQGEWKIKLPKQLAGGPYTMLIKGASNEVLLNEILFGDVWICSGQSNMELPMKRVAPIYKPEISAATYPAIRYFEVPKTYNFNNPQTDLKSGHWTPTDPNTVLDFSATAYFFAKEIYDRYKVPIGLINTALGGSPIESWISEDSIQRYPEYYEELLQFKNIHFIQQIQTEDSLRSKKWYDELRLKDNGYSTSAPWYAEKLPTSDWGEMNIPGFWKKENGKPVNGVMWFRKEIELPASYMGKSAKLILGSIVDADSVFVNEQFVGSTSYRYPPRRYAIPAGILNKGTNTIVIRVISNSGQGGFVEDKSYQLEVENQTIDLRGEWKYKLGAQMETLRGETFIRWKPVGLYNAMIAPLVNYSIKGVIWYQGESNINKPVEYHELFATLIQDWRSKWSQGNFPFLFVQLPNFMESKPQPSESNWASLRDSQLKTLSLPTIGMAVAIDIGEWNDIHPLNKKEVGHRLALAAQKIAYEDTEIVYSGPIYNSKKIDGNKIILTFTHIGSGLIMKGDKLNCFAIAGKDNQFKWAKAKIQDNTILVWSDEVMEPVAVRYAWADNPENANLYNKEGLPASPFKTDNQ